MHCIKSRTMQTGAAESHIYMVQCTLDILRFTNKKITKNKQTNKQKHQFACPSAGLVEN